MKWRAAGMMNATWLSRPIVVEIVSWETRLEFIISLICELQALYLSSGNAIWKVRVFISQPRKIINSVRKASAFNFGIEAISARSIGLSDPAFGQN